MPATFSLLRRWTNALIQQLKQDETYQLDPAITTADLLEVLAHRGFAALRGLFMGWRLKTCRAPLFLGSHVTLRHKKRITLGRSVILDDFVWIDALSRQGLQLGNNVTIGKFSILMCTGIVRELGEGIQMGDNVAVGASSFLGGQGGLTIGSHTILGPKVNIFPENHTFSSRHLPIRLQPNERKGIRIGEDCWIGSNSIILDGVEIGSGCVIAAGSVVTKSLPSFSVAAGVPARVIRNR